MGRLTTWSRRVQRKVSDVCGVKIENKFSTSNMRSYTKAKVEKSMVYMDNKNLKRRERAWDVKNLMSEAKIGCGAGGKDDK